MCRFYIAYFVLSIFLYLLLLVILGIIIAGMIVSSYTMKDDVHDMRCISGPTKVLNTDMRLVGDYVLTLLYSFPGFPLQHPAFGPCRIVLHSLQKQPRRHNANDAVSRQVESVSLRVICRGYQEWANVKNDVLQLYPTLQDQNESRTTVSENP